MASQVKTYNNTDDYEMFISIINGDISLSTPGAQSNTAIEITVFPDDVVYMMFENSMVNPIPLAEFQILDKENKLANYLKPINAKISILIRKKAITNEPPLIDLTFVIKNSKAINVKPDETTFHIWAELDNSIPLYTVCEYATTCNLNNDDEQMENPYEIARNILIQVGYKLFPLTSLDGNRK